MSFKLKNLQRKSGVHCVCEILYLFCTLPCNKRNKAVGNKEHFKNRMFVCHLLSVVSREFIIHLN